MTRSLRDAFDASGHGVADEALVTERRSLALFGHEFELCWIPQRAQRSGVPGDTRPSFRPDRGPSIRAAEAFWTRGCLVATPNRFPFLGEALLLWEKSGHAREVREGFLAEAFTLLAEYDASLVANTIGASAIPTAHAHWLWAPRPLLTSWPLREVAVSGDARLLATDVASSWPLYAAVVECADPQRRAWIARRLLDGRTRPAVNVLAQGDRVFLIPRRAEAGASDFPYAIGGGELSGRFVFPEETSFRSASVLGLEDSLRAACVDVTAQEISSLASAWASILDA